METEVLLKKKIRAPKLRFKGFNDGWRNEKIGDVINNKSPKYNPEKSMDSFKCIELEHLSTSTGELLGYIDSVNSASIKNKFYKGEVLFGKLRPYLRKYLKAPFDGVCSSEIWVLKGEKITDDFLYQIVQSDFFINLANQSTGSKMPRADWNVVASGIFHFPSIPEQQKIASYLSAVDEKIQQLNRKKELLEQYKKGVMQQLFSGKLRFKDQNGKEFQKWEKKKLGELCDVRDGTHDSPKYSNEGFPLITSKNLRSNGTLDFENVNLISEKDYLSINKRSKVCKGDILFAMIGTIGNPVIIDAEGFAIKNVALIKQLSELKNIFLIHFLRSDFLLSQFNQFNAGGIQKFISLGLIRNLIIFTPCIEEQEKIANYLSSIDNKIEIVNTQITQTQTFKKGLLQQMFV